MKIRRYTLTRFFIPLTISAVILGLLLYRIDGAAIIDSLGQCNIPLLLTAIIISVIINIFLGAEKWRQILIALGCRLPLYEILSIRTGCIPFKIVFPMRSSELLKAFYLSRHNRLSFNRAVSSLIFDKALNLFVIICFALIGLLFTSPPFSPLIPIILFLLTTPVLLFNRIPRLLVRFGKWIHPRLYPVVDDLASAFHSISIPEKSLLIILSFLCLSSEFASYLILFRAVGVTVPLPSLLLAVPAIMIISKLPITVLGLGTREAAVLFFFTAYGTPAALLSGSILISLVGYVLPVLIGLFFMRSFYLLFSLENQTPLH